MVLRLFRIIELGAYGIERPCVVSEQVAHTLIDTLSIIYARPQIRISQIYLYLHTSSTSYHYHECLYCHRTS